MTRTIRVCLPALAAAVLAVGCAVAPMLPFEPLPPPIALHPLGVKPLADARGEFRHVLCRVAQERKGVYPDEADCANMLHDLGGETLATGTKAYPNRSATVLIVPGIFGECVADQVTPFSDGLADREGKKSGNPYSYLEDLGYEVRVAPVRGRASSAHNADIVVTSLHELADRQAVVVIAYSKGVPDTLAAFRNLGPDAIPTNIRAFLSVAGVVSGTPIADELNGLYRDLLSRAPFSSCPPVDDGAVASLTRQERLLRLAAEMRVIPDRIQLFSLAAFAPRDRITFFMISSYDRLAVVEPRNDGQIALHDGLLPGSRLLGYVNSDHWAFVLGFNRARAPLWRGAINHNEFPREVLAEALLRFVLNTGADSGGP